MHIHNVYFWLNDDLSSEDVAAFESGLTALMRDPFIKSGHFGKPAATDRDVVENTYSYGIVVVFNDKTDHDSYQKGATHLAFLDAHMSKWNRVVVYDITI